MKTSINNKHVNVIEFLNKPKEEQEKLLAELQSMQKIESHHISLDIRKLSIPENPINPESWTKMENDLMNIYSSIFGGCESKRICDVCEKTLDLTTKNVDYRCNECGFRSDICNECQHIIFTDKLRQNHLRILKQCPVGVGCQDTELRAVANKYNLVLS